MLFTEFGEFLAFSFRTCARTFISLCSLHFYEVLFTFFSQSSGSYNLIILSLSVSGSKETPISMPKHMLASSLPQYHWYLLQISESMLAWTHPFPYPKLSPTHRFPSQLLILLVALLFQLCSVFFLPSLCSPCPHSLSPPLYLSLSALLLLLPWPRCSLLSMSGLLISLSALDSFKCCSLSQI